METRAHTLRRLAAIGVMLSSLMLSTRAFALPLEVPMYWNAIGMEDAPCSAVRCQSGLYCALDDLRNTRTCTNPWVRGVEMMWLSEAAYWDRASRAQRNTCIGQWGYSEYGYYYSSSIWEDAEALVAQRADRIVVAFSGTEIGISDAGFSDANTEITLPYASDIDGWPFGSRGWTSVEVHEGFLEFVLSVWPAVSSAVKKLSDEKPRPIFVTGHSLGGAAAMIFASMLREEYALTGRSSELHVVTFGSPKVGDSDWLDKYERDADLANRTERWVNEHDTVPQIPVRDIYVHAGRRIQVDHASCADDDAPCWSIEYDSPEYELSPRLGLHRLKHYRAALEAHVPDSFSSVADHACTEP